MGLMPYKKGEEVATTQAESDTPRHIAEGESNVSPEEQAQYDAFVKNGLKLIYAEGEVRPEVVESLRIKADALPQDEGNAPTPPIMALANAAVQITMNLDDSARSAGQPVTDDVLLHGGIAIVEELAEIAKEGRIYDYSEEEMQGALTVAVDMYRDKAIQDGRTTKETLEGQFGEAVKADQEGRLGEVLPGVE